MYREILHELLATTEGAAAVIFLDFEGETVDLVCDRPISDHDLRIFGAYHSIYLGVLREICAKLKIGAPRRFKLEFRWMTFLCIDLKDGYFVLLMLDHRGAEEAAWQRLERCKERLLEDM